MRILFTSDLHGEQSLYEQAFELSAKSGADAVILGGDILPTDMGGIFEESRMKEACEISLASQIEFIDGYLSPRIKALRKEHPEKEIFYIPGNHDWGRAILHMEERITEAANLHKKVTGFSGFEIMGYGCVTDSHFWVKDMVRRDMPADTGFSGRFSFLSTSEGIISYEDASYLDLNPSIKEELAAVRACDPSRLICVFHSPPYGTGLDTHHEGRPVGSKAIREYIERVQPLISLHGHIHEAPYMSGIYFMKTGRTISANPGRLKDDLHAVIIDITESGEPAIRHTLFRNPV